MAASTSEVAIRSSGVIAERYPALVEAREVASLLRVNLGEDGGLTIADLDRIRIPAGGGKAWEFTDLLTAETETMPEVVGIVAAWRKQRAFWVSQDPDDSPPDCASRDGIAPVSGGMFAADGERAEANPDGLCATCPMSKFGSHPKEGSSAQACREARLLFPLREGDSLPTLVQAPPTSLKPMRTFFAQLSTRKRVPHWAAVIALGLEQAVGGPTGKITYSKIKPRLVDTLEGVAFDDAGRPYGLPGTEAGLVDEYRKAFDAMLEAMTVAQVSATTQTVTQFDDGLGNDDPAP